MEPIQFHISILNSSGFGVRSSLDQGQVTNYHYHTEVQISWIRKGSGKLIINNELQNINEGDIFIIGSNAPHLITSTQENEESFDYKSIYFKPDFFGLVQNDSIDFQNVETFLEASKRGVFLKKENANSISQLMRKIEAGKLKLSNFIFLLELISMFIGKSNKTWISSHSSSLELNEQLGQRLNAVYQFSLENYRNEINLREIAKVANLSVSRFSAVFKKHSNRSYFSFLNELRIEDSCSQLRHQDKTIAQIAFESGFRNLSNFNRTFKKYKAMSPIEFKRQNCLYES